MSAEPTEPIGAADPAPAPSGEGAEGLGELAEAFVAPETFVQLRFVEVVMVLPSTHPLLVLEEREEPFRQLRIPIGVAEGVAIAYAARRIVTPRPLTHALFTDVLESFGVALETVRITAVRGSRYEAELVCSGPVGTRVFDCRPSDGVALALAQRLEVPLTATPAVLDQAGAVAPGASG